MNIIQPNRTAIYCYLNNDTKKGLDQLAKYFKTTKTSLIEEGVKMVIQARLKQIDIDLRNARQVSQITDQFSW